MADKTLNDLPVTTTPANADLMHISQSTVNKAITVNTLSEFVLQESDYATVIETRTANHDYTSLELLPDHRIFANPTGGNFILGFFNGSDRDGSIVTLHAIGNSENHIDLELVTNGVTDVTLYSGDTLNLIWNNTDSEWKILSFIRDSIYDYVIKSQEDFNFIIDRVAANQYKIKDNFKSIYFRFLLNGYQMSGVLSGGDTWGYIETNDCKNLIFEEDAFIDFNATPGYLEINTDNCYLQNTWIQGDGAIPAAIQRSFLLNALHVLFLNCKTSNRKSNVLFNCFEGSANSNQRQTTKYIGCHVFDIATNNEVRAFYNIENIISCIVKDISTSVLIVYGFHTCSSITAGRVQNISSTGTHVIAFYNGTKIADSLAFLLVSTSGVSHGFQNFAKLTNCSAKGFDAVIEANGFYECSDLSSCNTEGLDCTTGDSVGFNLCKQLASCYVFNLRSLSGTVGHDAIGYKECRNITGSYAYQILQTSNGLAAGFENCIDISGCEVNDIDATNGNAYGLFNCEEISACTINDIISSSGSGYGIHTCYTIGNCKVSSCSTDGVNNCEGVVNNKSINNTGNGFTVCISMGHNRSTGNGTNYSVTCFADWGGTIAVADTAAGGWNG